MNEDELNKYLDEHLKYYYHKTDEKEQGYFIHHNLPLVHKLIIASDKFISKFDNIESIDKINLRGLSKMDLLSKIKLLKEFYKEYNINIDIEKLIQNGSINPRFLDFKSVSIDKYTNAYYLNNNGNDDIFFPNSNLTLDFVFIAHELSHFSNKPNSSDQACILSEALAMYTESLACSFLENRGYKNESMLFKLIRLNNMRDCISSTLGSVEAKLTYITFGKINKENYSKLFKNRSYEEFLNNLPSKKDFDKVTISVRYIFGLLLSGYMINKIKNDYSFFQNIENLNNSINSLSFFEALEKINIYDLSDNTINMLYDCLIDNVISSKDIKITSKSK